MHLYLFRHGQSVENTRQWDGSNTNSELTDLGHAQAQALAEWLKPRLTFDKLYASTMQRARQTAGYIADALDLEITFDDRLREVGNSRPDASPFPDDALPTYHLNVWGSVQPYKSITRDGENWMQFRARIGGFLESLIEDLPEDHLEINMGVVCHGGVIEGFFEHIFEKGPRSTVIVVTNNTGIVHLQYRPNDETPDWVLHYQNVTNHLDESQIS